MGKKIPLEQRMAERTVRRGECLIWTGCVGSDGYPSVTFGHSNTFRLSRVIWEKANGPIANGLMVCHRCDTPRCVEIAHFFLGTAKDNTNDMYAKGRFPVRRGDRHHATKIPDAELAKVRARRAAGEKLRDIAEDYGVCFQSISAVCLGVRKCAN